MPVAPQPYSLVFNGPSMVMLPSCSPTEQSARRCGPHMLWQANSTCRCQQPWVGSSCDLVPLPVGPGTFPCLASQLDMLTTIWLSSHHDVAASARANLYPLQPDQWLVFAFRLCR